MATIKRYDLYEGDGEIIEPETWKQTEEDRAESAGSRRRAAAWEEDDLPRVRPVRSVELRAPDFGAVSRMGQDAVAWTEEECAAGPVYVRPGSVRAVILEAGGQAEL